MSQALADSAKQEKVLFDRFASTHHQRPPVVASAWRDLRAIISRDPPFDSGLEVIEIGEGAKVGADSVVLKALAAHTTVVGNPARQVGSSRHAGPALDIDQSFDDS